MIRTLALAAMLVALIALPLPRAAAEPPRAELTEARDRLDRLTRDLEIQIEECNLRREQLKAAERAVDEHRAELDDVETQVVAADEQRGAVVAELYKLRTGAGRTSALLPAVDSLGAYAEHATWLDITQQARTGVLEEYRATRDRLDARTDVLDDTRERAQQADEEAQRTCADTERMVEAQQDRVEELADEVARLEAEARAAEARAREADAEPEDASTPADTAPVAAPAASGSAGAAVQFALAQIGKPYAWGGSGPNSYDCSGLTSSAWAAAGVSLPHNSGMQYGATARVSRSQLVPGDLLFFGSPIHHVGMYIGNGQMVEAPRTGLSVRVVSIERSGYVGAGRVR